MSERDHLPHLRRLVHAAHEYHNAGITLPIYAAQEIADEIEYLRKERERVRQMEEALQQISSRSWSNIRDRDGLIKQLRGIREIAERGLGGFRGGSATSGTGGET